MSEFCGLGKHENNQHALVPPKTGCGCPGGQRNLKKPVSCATPPPRIYIYMIKNKSPTKLCLVNYKQNQKKSTSSYGGTQKKKNTKNQPLTFQGPGNRTHFANCLLPIKVTVTAEFLPDLLHFFCSAIDRSDNSAEQNR